MASTSGSVGAEVTGETCSSLAKSSLPPPRPKSPPEYPDLYGKRREAARVQMLEREIGYLEGEIKFIEGVQPASRCCKEVSDFVVANSDPLIPAQRKSRRHCRFWKWLWSFQKSRNRKRSFTCKDSESRETRISGDPEVWNLRTRTSRPTTRASTGLAARRPRPARALAAGGYGQHGASRPAATASTGASRRRPRPARASRPAATASTGASRRRPRPARG
ncbi:G-protein gamma-like domain protein [Raphanus sativus]|nr:G-protein gamma-like domain protein [Raphanus sativus]